MPIKIQKIQAATNQLKLLVYGPSGIGKTYLAGTACDVPEMSPVLVADVEGGLASIADRDVDVVAIQTWSNLMETCNYLLKNPETYNCLVIDSMSMLFDLCLREIMGSRTDDMPQQRDWGKAAQTFLTFAANLAKLPCHIIATALEDQSKDAFSGNVLYTIDVPGKSKKRLPAYFDVVGRLTVAFPDGPQSATRALQVQPFGKYVAKDRWGLSQVIMREPTMGKIYYKTTDTETEETPNE